MDNKEKLKHIEEIYNNALEKLRALENKQREIIQSHIRELEEQKIEALKKDIQSNN